MLTAVSRPPPPQLTIESPQKLGDVEEEWCRVTLYSTNVNRTHGCSHVLLFSLVKLPPSLSLSVSVASSFGVANLINVAASGPAVFDRFASGQVGMTFALFVV